MDTVRERLPLPAWATVRERLTRRRRIRARRVKVPKSPDSPQLCNLTPTPKSPQSPQSGRVLSSAQSPKQVADLNIRAGGSRRSSAPKSPYSPHSTVVGAYSPYSAATSPGSPSSFGHSSFSGSRRGSRDSLPKLVHAGARRPATFTAHLSRDETPREGEVLGEIFEDEFVGEDERNVLYDSDVEDEIFGALEEDDYEDVDFYEDLEWMHDAFPPDNFVMPENATQPPAEKLSVEYIYGYKGYFTHNNLMYTSGGDVTYNVGCKQVVLNLVSKEQRFPDNHNYEIMSTALHPSGSIIATAERERHPFIKIWELGTFTEIASLGGHERGVCCMAFSVDGTKLVSVGAEQPNRVVLWRWREKEKNIIAQMTVDSERIFDISVSPDGSIAIGGVLLLAFIVTKTIKPNVKGFRATLAAWPAALEPDDIPTIICVEFDKVESNLADLCLCGAENGDVYAWRGNELEGEIVDAHKGPVTCLQTFRGGFVTGGKDGKIKLWKTEDLSLTKCVDMCAIAGPNTRVRSVMRKSGKLLVGTLASEVYEVDESDNKGTLLVRGHAQANVYGLGVHPKRSIAATGGDDGVLRLIDLEQHSMYRVRAFKRPLRSIAYSPDGHTMAVGSFDGTFYILKSDTLETLATRRNRKGTIRDLKFSPDSRFLAVGSDDGYVDLFECRLDYSFFGSMDMDPGEAVMHLDWSVDSKSLKASSSSSKLLFWKVADQEEITYSEIFCNIEWDTYTDTLGWPVHGLYHAGDRTTAVCRSLSGKLLVTAHTDGLVRLYRYPCCTDDAQPKPHMFVAHSTAVRNVRFSFDDKYVISTGSTDRCIVQWSVKSAHDFKEAEVARKQQEKPKGRERHRQVDKVVDKAEADTTAADTLALEEKRRAQRAKLEQEVAERRAKKEAHRENAQSTRDPPYAEMLAILEDEELRQELHPRDHRISASREEAISDPDEALRLVAAGKPLFQHKHRTHFVGPSAWVTQDNAGEAPVEALQMEFIHGFPGKLSRNVLSYNIQGDAVYPVGPTGVVYNFTNHTQRFFSRHTDDIVALAMHKNFDFVATGQVGHSGTIHVWSSVKGDLKAALKNIHIGGVGCLNFSKKSGKFLVSVGVDVDNTIAVWDWTTQACLASVVGGTNKIFAVQFTKSDTVVVTAGVQQMKYWTVTGKLLRGHMGVFATSVFKDLVSCCIYSQKGRCYTGSDDGELSRWKNEEQVVVLKNVHTGPIYCLWVCRDGVASGGKDGLVNLFSLQLSPLMSFNVKELSCMGPETQIRSVCWFSKSVLVGTNAGEIFELYTDASEPKLIIEGHSGWGLSALAVHPTLPEFCTGGSDRIIRQWDAPARSVLHRQRQNAVVCSLDYSASGDHIACGLADGKLIIMDCDLHEEFVKADRSEPIRCVSYSADGRYIAAATTVIDLYDASQEYAWVFTFEGHIDPVLHMDWSLDSTVLQSNCASNALLAWDIVHLKEITAYGDIRDVEWHTCTCCTGWALQGLTPAFGEQRKLLSVCRSAHGTALAVGDVTGIVKLYRFPCVVPAAECRKYGAHSSAVSCVRFLMDDSTLVSVGLDDGMVVQWRHLSQGKPKPIELANVEPEEEVHFKVALLTTESTGELEDKERRPVLQRVSSFETEQSSKQAAIERQLLMEVANPDLSLPTGFVPDVHMNDLPDESLRLEFIHGYRAHDSRSNLFYTRSNDIVYTVAALAVVYSAEHHVQSYYNGHTDDILCLALHPQQDIAVTGQVGTRAHLCVWSTTTICTLSSLRGAHERGVAAVAFTADGDRVVSVGLEGDYVLALWHWSSAKLLTKVCFDASKHLSSVLVKESTVLPPPRCFAVLVNPVDGSLATLGSHHIRFWTFDAHNDYACTHVSGEHNSVPVTHTLMAGAFGRDGLAVTGSQTGDLLMWKGNLLEWKYNRAHVGAVTALCISKEGFVSGGQDGRVRVWAGLDPIKLFDFAKSGATPRLSVQIRALYWKEGRILIGTMASDIIELDETSALDRTLVRGHCEGEIKCVDTHPGLYVYATGGEDHSVRVWDMRARRLTAAVEVEAAAHCIAYSHTGDHLAVGLGNGKLVVFTTDPLSMLYSRKVPHRKQALTALRYSPSGQWLVAGGVDGVIDVYDVFSDYHLLGVCEGHTSHILSFDWLSDSSGWQAEDAGGHVLYWDVGVCEPMEKNAVAQIHNAEWHTWSLTQGWPVQGVERTQCDKLVVAIERSVSHSLLVAGDRFGLVKLFRWPCLNPQARCRRHAGHSQRIAAVRFSFDDLFVVSVGAHDRAIFQWRIIK